MQTSSVAVGATVVALVIALAGSGFAMRERGRAGDGLTVGTASSASNVSVAPAESANGAVTDNRSRRQTPTVQRPATGAAGQGDAATASTAAASSEGTGAGGHAGTTAGGPPLAASGDGSRPASEGSRVELRPAAPGDWRAVARIVDRTGLLGANEQQVETTVVAGPTTSGAQRIDVDDPILALSGETVRYDGPGRRAFVLDIWTGEPDTTQFTTSDGFLDVPAVARPDASWSWTAQTADRRTSLDATLRLVGTGRGTYAGGRELEVVELEETLTLGGDQALTITRRVKFAPALGLPVWISEDTKGTNRSGTTVDRSVIFELSDDEPGSAPVVDSP